MFPSSTELDCSRNGRQSVQWVKQSGRSGYVQRSVRFPVVGQVVARRPDPSVDQLVPHPRMGDGAATSPAASLEKGQS